MNKKIINPLSTLIHGNWVNGILVLCATTAMALAVQTSVWAQNFKTIHNFDLHDGGDPEAGLLQAANGNLYGTTYLGGGNMNSCELGCGTVFKIATNGKLTTLHSFDGTDGSGPSAAPLQAVFGSIYGTTVYGGANEYPLGDGTVFKITSGKLMTLYNFCSEADCADGVEPEAGLIQADNGSLYGTTDYGGDPGQGTVFKMNPWNGKLTTLHAFDGTDGSLPTAGLLQVKNGNLYGTTYAGGVNNGGTIFKINPWNGTLKTLYNFCSKSHCTDGAYPLAGWSRPRMGAFTGRLLPAGRT
jgi:uncharacterized repeat protein (TIGR03803 family)